MTPEERFERIESTLERVGQRLDQMAASNTEADKTLSAKRVEFEERMARIAEAHQELEAAQKNTEKALSRFIEESQTRGREVDERIANLTILVDRLVARDLERGSNGREE